MESADGLTVSLATFSIGIGESTQALQLDCAAWRTQKGIGGLPSLRSGRAANPIYNVQKEVLFYQQLCTPATQRHITLCHYIHQFRLMPILTLKIVFK